MGNRAIDVPEVLVQRRGGQTADPKPLLGRCVIRCESHQISRTDAPAQDDLCIRHDLGISRPCLNRTRRAAIFDEELCTWPGLNRELSRVRQGRNGKRVRNCAYPSFGVT